MGSKEENGHSEGIFQKDSTVRTSTVYSTSYITQYFFCFCESIFVDFFWHFGNPTFFKKIHLVP